MTEEEERNRVLGIAQEWIGTPFHDCGQIKGAGTDCAMLIKCVYVEAGLVEDFPVAPYSPQHFLHSAEERYLGTVLRFAREIPLERVKPADIALWKIGKAFAHGAIVIRPGWPNIIHAHFRARCVRRGSGTAVHLGTRILDLKFFSRW